jgi:hypothetical protein
MAEPFPWKDLGWQESWLPALEEAGVAKVRLMLSPGVRGDHLLLGSERVPKVWAQAWHDHQGREAEKAREAEQVAREERMIEATKSAASAAKGAMIAAWAAVIAAFLSAAGTIVEAFFGG